MSSPGTCAVCGSAALRPHLRVAGESGPDGLIPTTKEFGVALGDIARCTSCGHMQLDPLPSEERLREAYGEAGPDDYAEEESGQRATAAALLERIEALTEPGRLLDVGSWLGFLLAEARDRGWDPVGVEPSEAAADWARDRFGLDVRVGGVDEVPAGPFDAVVMGDVIEHLTDPGAALDRLASVMAPTGVLALAVPDAGSRLARAMGKRWWSVIPTHVQYFTRESLSRLLRDHGFDLLDVTTAPKAFTVRYYLGRIEGYSRPVGRGLVRAAEKTRLADRIWAPDFRDRMLVLARPRG